MSKLRERLARTYFVFDARSLGLFRIVFGVVLLTDLALRYRALDAFYTNAGLLPNHTLLWAPPAQHVFSIFYTASSHGQALLLMALCALVFVSLLIGFRTKLSQVLSLLALTSMNARLAPLENGGDMVMNLLAVWTVFLPLGRRFSVDALLASLRAHPEHFDHDLADRAAIRAEQPPYHSLAVLALILQFTVVYYFNVVHKTGSTWVDGTAVHYTLHQDRLVKPFGVWFREHVPFEVLRALAYGTIVVESLGAVTIVTPFFVKQARVFAVIVMPLLHLGFELCLDLGVFSFAVMAFYPLLLLPEHWAFLKRTLQRVHRRRIVLFDASCGVCFSIARALARLDLLDRLELRANTQREGLPAQVTPELLDGTIVVIDEPSGRLYTRAAAIAQILRALPGGFLLALPMQLPGVHQLANVCYNLFAYNRAQISTSLGLAACGLPSAAPVWMPSAPETPARRLARRVGRVLAEACVVLVMASALGEIVNANGAVPAALRYQQPAFLQAITEYPRLFQGWRMFAPQAPLEDFMIEIDAETSDGRHVDPYNEVASRVHGPGLREIPKLLQQNQFFTAYSLFIWRPHFRPYLTAFQEWVLRYPERTGRPKDRIVRFTAYKLSDLSPAPGQRDNTKFAREAFLRYH